MPGDDDALSSRELAGSGGERVVPGAVDRFLWEEHLSRYLWIRDWVDKCRVVDLGCGTGYGTDLLGRSGARIAVGVDRSFPALAFARGEFSHAHFIEADLARGFPFVETFDRVIAFEILEHLEDPGRFVRLARELLDPGGWFVLSTPNRRSYVDVQGIQNPFHVRELYREELESLLRDSFPVVEIWTQDTMESQVFAPVEVAADAPPRVSNSALEASIDPDLASYFLAVASDEPLPAELSMSHRSFPGESKELHRLREELIRAVRILDDREDELQAARRQLGQGSSRGMAPSDPFFPLLPTHRHLLRLYEEALQQLEAETRARTTSEEALEAIRNSTFWRATLPLRRLSDLLKAVLGRGRT